jgi:Asp-tRNA(Asn)/Glu-tRNA(Gln) amidotransferase A subunit family amidase
VKQREDDVLAFVCRNEEGARAAAEASTRRWRDGAPLSDIDGMPIGVKDVIETADMPTQMGSPLYAGWRSHRDSASVYALREAGAVIVGKTVTTEFAATEPGPTRNPWDLERTPGGSSSGSAAGVAAGFFSAALGTQVVGSILRPASYCGVIGFKPTFGAINRGGSHDHMSQSAQGVLAASLADAWAVLRAIADRAGGDPGHRGLEGAAQLEVPSTLHTLIVLETPGWAEASEAAKRSFALAMDKLAKAGARVLRRKDDAKIEAVEAALARAMLVTRKINAWESRWPLNTYRDRDAKKLSRTMVERAAEAEAMTLPEFRSYLTEREEMRAAYAKLADVGDVCVTLSAPAEAPTGLASTGNPSFVVPGSLLGVPAVSLPVLSAHGLPLGLQVMGFADQDRALMGTAAAIEAKLGRDLAVRA